MAYTIEKRANNSAQYRRNGNKKTEFNKNITCSEVLMLLYKHSCLKVQVKNSHVPYSITYAQGGERVYKGLFKFHIVRTVVI